MATNQGQIAQAYVRVRPDLAGFKGELETQLKTQLHGASTSVKAPLADTKAVASHDHLTRKLKEEHAALVSNGRVATEASAKQVAASRSVVAAATAETAARTRATVSTEAQAEAAVASAAVQRRADEALLHDYSRLAGAARRGSAEQISAARLVEAEQRRLGTAVTRTGERSILAAHSLGRAERGALAATGVFQHLGRSIAFASGTFLGAYGLVGVTRAAIAAGTDLESTLSELPTLFGRSSEAAVEFGDTSFKGLGIAKSTAVDTLEQFGLLLRGMHVLPGEAEKVSEELTKVGLALSLAKGEQDATQANQAIISALTGRGVALRRYGVAVDQTSIKGEALRLGLVRTAVDSKKVEIAFQRLEEAQAALQAQQTKLVTDPLAVSRAQTAVTAAHVQLQKALRGTAVELTKTERTQAASSLVVRGAKRYLDEYGASLEDTSLGKQRRFHEGTQQLQEDLGLRILPSFNAAIEVVDEWLTSISEGGARHAAFEHDLNLIGVGARNTWKALSIGSTVLRDLTAPIGGVVHGLEILAALWGVNKILLWAEALQKSRLAVLLFGATTVETDAAVVAANERVAASEAAIGATSTSTATRVAAGNTVMAASAAAPIGRFASLKGAIEGVPRLLKIGIVVVGAAEALKLINIVREGVKEGQSKLDIARKFGAEEERFGAPFVRATLGPGAEDAVKRLAGIIAPPPRGKAKSDSSATQIARQMRAGNYAENAIYAHLRAIGFSNAAARDAIRSTREGFEPPSPEDVAGRTVGVTRAQARRDLSSIATVIESGREFSVAQAKKLSGQLAAVAGEIGTAGFGPAMRSKLKAEVGKLSDELSSATKNVGTAALANLRRDRDEIAGEITALNQRISDTIKQGGEQMADALRSARQAEHDAIVSAKANLNQLGQTLAGQIAQFEEREGDQAPISGPLKRQLDRLNRLIHEGKATPALIRQAQKVEAELNQQQAQQADKRQRVTRGLADITDEFNQGKISLAQFNREVTALLKREGVSYRAAGKSLGIAFADGFREALKELREQARQIARTPAALRRGVSGLEQPIVNPREVIAEQNRQIARIATENAKELRGEIRERSKLEIKQARDDAAIAKITGQHIVEAVRGQRPAGSRGTTRAQAPSPERPRTERERPPRPAAPARPAPRPAILGPEAIEALRTAAAGASRGIVQRGLIYRELGKLDTDLKNGDGAARGQRAALLREERTQTHELRRILTANQRGNDVLRDVERTLRHKRHASPANSPSAAETRMAANQNLTL